MNSTKIKVIPSKFYALNRVLQEFKEYKGRVLIIFCLGLVISAIQPASVKLSQRIVDELQKGTLMDAGFFRWVPLFLICLFFISGCAKYSHNVLRRYITEKVVLKFRAALFEKYLMFPLSVLDKKRTGEMMASIQNDLAQVSSGIDTLVMVLKEPFTFMGLLGVAFYCDWRLALSTLVVAPLVAMLFSRSGQAVKRYSARNLERISDLMSVSQESLVGSRVVKVFQLEFVLLKRFRDIQANYFKTVFKSIRVEELSTPLVEFIGSLLIAGVIVYGGYRTSHGLLSSGELVAFIIAIGLAQMPLKQLNNAFLKLKTAEAAAERVFAILDDPSALSLGEGSQRITEVKNEIRFENVSLDYSGNHSNKNALHDVSFVIKPGQCIAFVGHSGSGKSSIVNLLPRLYEVSSGRITIDGIDIRRVSLSDLRRLISFVTQDTFLFNDTILENIRYGNPQATMEQIQLAVEQAHCSDFIKKLQLGLETKIGDRGVCLSGGEKQRVAIARAILKNAPILVLDEATSSLDSQSEAIVQDALEELIERKTTLMVAHRLSTVKKADRIFVVEHGKIHETGTHQELMGSKGVYSQYFERQLTRDV